MSDSRRASNLQLEAMQQRVASQTRVIQFMACILISLLLVHFTSGPDFYDSQHYVLFLVYFSIGLWITEAIPPFAVGVMIVGFLVFFLGQPDLAAEGIEVQEFVNTWSNSVIWLLLGGFFLAAGMKKSGLDLEIFQSVITRFAQNPAKLLLALMLSTAGISMLMSNTATTAMMLAALSPLMSHLGSGHRYVKSLLLGIPAAASIGGMGTIIGSPPNAIAVDAINRLENIPFEIGFFEWMIFGFPVAILLTIIVYVVLVKKYPPPEQLELDIADPRSTEHANETVLDPIQERNQKIQRQIVLGVLTTTVLLWLTDGLHPIPTAAVSGIPIIALTMLNVVNGRDVRSLPWDTLMLVAGGLSLGLAIEETGLAHYFVSSLQYGQVPPLITIVFFAFITVVASNFMSNTAATAILVPAAGLWTGVDPIIMPLVIGLSASCALFLPVSTPPNAIAYATGFLKQADFRISGLTAGILGPILVILWCFFLLYISS